MTVFYESLNIKEMPAEDAWKMLEAADSDKDVDDIKSAMLYYAGIRRAYPDLRFEELEQVFRDAEMNTYLIAKQQEVGKTHTIVNFQGNQDQEYVVSIQFSAKPRRKAFQDGWPVDSSDNMVRLAKAGFVMNNHQQVCSRCEEVGHTQKSCPQDAPEKVSTMACHVCHAVGEHYSRDCPQERKGPAKKGCSAQKSSIWTILSAKNAKTLAICKFPAPRRHNNADSFKKCERLPQQAVLQLRRARTYRKCSQAAAEGETGGDGGFGDDAAAGGDNGGGW
ncbi:hypothetical protein LTR27_001997 [Elasticomyces elasticus]|nr:hypothetical protein LTR27_001997 [Elasticomyces elasticus]